MLPIKIAASVLSADLAQLGSQVEKVLAAGADWVHFDVMDNHYVPNLTFGPLLCRAIRRYTGDAYLDVHLMVTPVDRLIGEFADAGADLITFHLDATTHIDRSLALVRKYGCGCGVALNPATPITVLDCILPQLDMVLLMSVNPGFGGQSFIPYVLPKIGQLRGCINACGKPIRLAVDGGINLDNLGAIAAAGADTLIAGSLIFNAIDYTEVIIAMRTILAAANTIDV